MCEALGRDSEQAFALMGKLVDEVVPVRKALQTAPV